MSEKPRPDEPLRLLFKTLQSDPHHYDQKMVEDILGSEESWIKNEYYLEPYFLFSFFPYQSLQEGKVLKLYPGFRFINNRWKTKNVSLEIRIEPFHFTWGGTINDQFKKGCAVNKSHDIIKIPKVYRPLYKTGFWPEPKRDTFFLTWKKPLLIPLRCLNKERQNSIKLWWSVERKHEHEFLPQLMNVEINFFYPQKVPFSISLKKEQSQKILINQGYFITTGLGKKPEIKPIYYQLIDIQNNLHDKYSENQPFNSLWTIKYHPFQINYVVWKRLLQYFAFSDFKNDFLKMINGSISKPEKIMTANILNNQKERLLTNRLALLNHIRHTINANIPAFIRQPESSKKIHYYQTTYRNVFTTKNSWNWKNHQLMLNPRSQYTFLATSHNHHNEINLISKFDWNNIIPIQFLINQNTIITNNFLHKNLHFTKISSLPKLPTKVNIFIISKQLLKEIANNLPFSFLRYQDLKTEYARYYVEKDR